MVTSGICLKGESFSEPKRSGVHEAIEGAAISQCFWTKKAGRADKWDLTKERIIKKVFSGRKRKIFCLLR